MVLLLVEGFESVIDLTLSLLFEPESKSTFKMSKGHAMIDDLEYLL